MSAVEHLDAIERYAGSGIVDVVLVNDAPITTERLQPYVAAGAELVEVDCAALEARGVSVVAANLLDDGELIRHAPERLAREIVALAG